LQIEQSSVLPELRALEALGGSLEKLGHPAALEVLHTLESSAGPLPVYALRLGSTAPDAPVLMCVGGVHGLERIGAQVVLSYVETLIAALTWDRTLHEMLASVRLCFVPVLNPVGILMRRRGNGNGVDLMRNAPVDSDEREWFFKLHRGQRWSRYLPWFRGSAKALESETQALCDFVSRQGGQSRFMLALDVHSGFVGADRLWFPYARTRALFPHAPEMLALKQLLDATYPKHRYVVEPQASQYTTHGDVWDYLYDGFRGTNPRGLFLPLTLELGASSWLRKNWNWRVPSKLAFFHPLEPNRTRRVLRRHIQLFEFLLRAVYSWERWAELGPSERAALERDARVAWGT
jgi:zinc carboxypeptidase